jgi:hypothetical protein
MGGRSDGEPEEGMTDGGGFVRGGVLRTEGSEVGDCDSVSSVCGLESVVVVLVWSSGGGGLVRAGVGTVAGSAMGDWGSVLVSGWNSAGSGVDRGGVLSVDGSASCVSGCDAYDTCE